MSQLFLGRAGYSWQMLAHNGVVDFSFLQVHGILHFYFCCKKDEKIRDEDSRVQGIGRDEPRRGCGGCRVAFLRQPDGSGRRSGCRHLYGRDRSTGRHRCARRAAILFYRA